MAYVEAEWTTERAVSHCAHQLSRRFGVTLVAQSEFDGLPMDANPGTRSKNSVRASSACLYDDSTPKSALRDLASRLLKVGGMEADDSMKRVLTALEREGVKVQP